MTLPQGSAARRRDPGSLMQFNRPRTGGPSSVQMIRGPGHGQVMAPGNDADADTDADRAPCIDCGVE